MTIKEWVKEKIAFISGKITKIKSLFKIMYKNHVELILHIAIAIFLLITLFFAKPIIFFLMLLVALYGIINSLILANYKNKK